MKRITTTASAIIASSLSLQLFSEPVIQLDEFEVVSQRYIEEKQSISTAEPIDSESILKYTPQDLTQFLNTEPAISAYRRTSARAAHPTTQGIRFRNNGANAASRSLVLLNGIPQNDPFGGWVFWNRIHLDSIHTINISPIGHNELWGNLGSGGLISLDSDSSLPERDTVSLGYNDHSSYELAIGKNSKNSKFVTTDIDLRFFKAAGFVPLHPDQRGEIDEKSESKTKAYRIQQKLDNQNGWVTKWSVDYFKEKRKNGTPLSRNESEAWDFSLSTSKLIDDSSQISLSSYYQDRDYANQFTSVNEDRSSERVALDQFAVPADALGLSLVYAKQWQESLEILTGIDGRWTEGEVYEKYRNLGSGFTRQRVAGGEQSIIGAFISAQIQLADKLEATLSTRVDQIEQNNGFRRETNLETGSVIRNDKYSNREDWETSLNASLSKRIGEKQSVSVMAFQGFRAPTLNELYRPFRVKNDIVEANPELSNEKQTGVQVSYDAAINDAFSFGVRGFHYDLENTVANVLVTTEPGFHPLCGFIPAGGSCSHRMNIEESSITGFEINLNAQITETLSSKINYTYAPTEISQSTQRQELIGKAFAQSPESRLYAELNWQANEKTLLWASASYWDEQFDDGENTRLIDSALSIDLGANFALNERSTLSLRIENATDELIESGRSSSGLISISAPRTAWLRLTIRK